MNHPCTARGTTSLAKTRGVRLGWMAVLIMSFVSVSLGGTFVAFGPEDYIRAKGKPAPLSTRFTVLNPNTNYTLHINDGGLKGEFARVSSTVIKLNGVEIVGPSDFNQKVTVIERPTTVLSINALDVELRSGPEDTSV